VKLGNTNSQTAPLKCDTTQVLETNVRYVSRTNSADAHDVISPFQQKSRESTSAERILKKKQALHVLIVDDDDVDNEKIRRYLKNINLDTTVSTALSGFDAINKIANDKTDIILLDYNLGDMTGVELLQNLSDGLDKYTQIIMITGAGDEQVAVSAMQLGVYDYIPKKNLTQEKLTTTLYAALRRAGLEQRLALSQEKMYKMSLYDSLTGLPNRNLFFDRLSQMIMSAERNEDKFSVIMIDLNLFKEINDSLGHIAGDDVLKVIGHRLNDLCRKTDTISRLGGDEFACLIRNTYSVESIATFVEKLDHAINEPIMLMGHLIQVGASIGISIYPDHAVETNGLLSCADKAMYEAKRNNSRYVIYSQSHHSGTLNNIPVSNYLPTAIEKKQLFFEYQPKVSLETRELVGVEALLRWNHPEIGLISPAQFIHLAEMSSIINQLTYATFDMVFDQIKLWHGVGLNIPVSLNLSARMLDDRKLVNWLLKELLDRGISAEDIILEITETALSSNTRDSQKILQQLSEAKLRLSIDDFGSGFTSFRYIRDIELHEIKIDRLFMQQLNGDNGKDIAIVRSIIMLADNLNVNVIAEGIETHKQWTRLQQLGCRYGQGFLISRPLPAEKLLAWQESWNNSPVFNN